MLTTFFACSSLEKEIVPERYCPAVIVFPALEQENQLTVVILKSGKKTDDQLVRAQWRNVDGNDGSLVKH